MNDEPDWMDYWEKKFGSESSNFEADRGTNPRGDSLESLSRDELLEFIDPGPADVVFDAGCGSGANIALLHDKVQRIIAMDFAFSAVERVRARIASAEMANVSVSQGNIASPHLPTNSIDKVICMSVFHYLSDEEVGSCLQSFHEALRPGGSLILHVKNLSSLYIGTLYLSKAILRKVGLRTTETEFYRSFRWYIDQLTIAGFQIENFNSFNFFVVDRMPQAVVNYLQQLELSRREKPLFKSAFVRKHGADLKIRARVPV